MKKTVYLFISFFFLVETYSQKTLDSAEVRCTYQLTFLPDSTRPDRKQSDILQLLIGKNVSSFFSYITFRADSAFNADIESGNIPFETMIKDKSMQKKYKSGGFYSKYCIYSDNKASKIFIKDKIGSQYFIYEEKQDTIRWEISLDTTTLLNYFCQKAQTHYRGRDYIAWFTNEIPIGQGPYKFNGLPGLIVKIADTKQNFVFECLSVEKLINKVPIQLDVKKCITTTRQDFRKAFKAMFDNPWESLTTGSNVTIGGKDLDKIKETLQHRVPFNPIELE